MSVEPLILNEQINICRESSDFHGTFSVSFVFSLLYSLKCNMIISYLEPFQNLKYNFSTGNLIWLSTISTVLPQTYSSLSPGLKSLSGLWDSFFFLLMWNKSAKHSVVTKLHKEQMGCRLSYWMDILEVCGWGQFYSPSSWWWNPHDLQEMCQHTYTLLWTWPDHFHIVPLAKCFYLDNVIFMRKLGLPKHIVI